MAEAEFWNDVTTWTDRRIVLTAEAGEVIDAHALTVARADPEDRGDETGGLLRRHLAPPGVRTRRPVRRPG
ncbi:hypothetical protein [Streptomyces sp. CNQ085]|uniref:hypothetical protein n=1 Tax=Streptomyces sp. CNQ085 TaxID=2886944 RepID=UPI001F510062|nr:hypothetical protein [Streptomyces sp. CNQ085]MCI0386148.1 hypothetical protein [Streptomyces sp. CNQ085]